MSWQLFGGVAEDLFMLANTSVYRCAIDHLAFVFEAIQKLPANLVGLGDQWRGAAISVPKNIAEAIGSSCHRERFDHLAVARDEALECAEILELVRLLDTVPADELDRAESLLAGVVEMLADVTTAIAA